MPPAVKSKEAIAKAAAAGGRQKKKVRASGEEVEDSQGFGQGRLRIDWRRSRGVDVGARTYLPRRNGPKAR